MNASLLIPCHNAAAFLPALLASIRALTVPFSEVLCYDDGSTDDTLAVARQLGLRIIPGGTNRGASHARNQLARHATGEWLHFQDADDPLLPEFLEAMQPLLRPEVDVALCDSDWLDADTRSPVLLWRHPPASLRADPLLANLRTGVSSNAMIIRRSSLLAVGGFDEALSMWEDADLHIRLAAAGFRYDALGRVASVSLRRPGSFSHDYRRSWNCRLEALTRYADSLPTRTHAEIAAQAETAARELLKHQDMSGARRALALNHRLGGNAPISHHPLLRALRRLFGAWLALRVQHHLRTCR